MSRPLSLILAAALALPCAARADGDGDAFQLFHDDSKVVSPSQVVSASKYHLDPSQVPASIQVITADDIARYGYDNVAEALRSLTGLFVEDTHTYQNLGVRGFSILGDYASRVLVLVDGNAVNDPVWGSGSIGDELGVDITDVKRIEVVMGPGSAIYGSHAMAAVVNIITKKGSDLRGLALEGGLGSGMAERARLQAGGLAGGVDWYASGSLLNSAGMDLDFGGQAAGLGPSSVVTGEDGEQASNVLAKLAFGGFSLQSSYTERTKDIATTAWGVDYGRPGSLQRDGGWMTELRYAQALGDDADWSARAYVRDNWSSGEYLFITSGYGDLRQFDDGNWGGLELQLNWQSSEGNHLTVGGELVNTWRMLLQSWTDVSGTLLDRTVSMSVGSGYLQDLYKPWDSLTLVGGLRYSRYSTFGDAWSPRAGLLLDLPARSTAKLLWGTAFNAPSASALFWTDNVTELGNPALQPEKLSTWELVLENAVAPGLKASASLYYNDIYDLIKLVPDPAYVLPIYENTGHVRTRGVDVSLKGDWDNVKASLGYTYQNTVDVATGLPLANSAADSAHAGLSWPFLGNRLYVSGEAVYSGLTETYNGYWISPNVRTDLTVYETGLVPHLNLTLKVRNLFDSVSSVPISEEPALVETVPQDRRSYQVRASLPF